MERSGAPIRLPAAVLATAGAGGSVAVAGFGPCDPQLGIETDFPFRWEVVYGASVVAIAVAAGLFTFGSRGIASGRVRRAVLAP